MRIGPAGALLAVTILLLLVWTSSLFGLEAAIIMIALCALALALGYWAHKELTC